MTLDWNEHPEAREEFLNAHERYLGVEDGRLGDEFADVAEFAAHTRDVFLHYDADFTLIAAVIGQLCQSVTPAESAPDDPPASGTSIRYQ